MEPVLTVTKTNNDEVRTGYMAIDMNSYQTMSPSIAKLIEALAKAQGEIVSAKKDTSNPFFKSKYADLASVWDAIRAPLSTNGLAVVQTTSSTETSVTVNTMLAHASGEWIRGSLTMKPTKADPQGIGSAITYARRYALASMCGVAPEDDDGNAASLAGQNAPGPISKKQAEELKTLIKETKTDVTKLCTAYKVESPDALPASQYASVMELLAKKKVKEVQNANH